MKRAGRGHSTHETSFMVFRFQRNCSGSVVLEYAVLLGFIVIGGLAAYFGVFHHGSRIFDRLASLKDYDTSYGHDFTSANQEDNEYDSHTLTEKETAQAVQAESDAAAGRLAVVSCLVIIAGILVGGSFFLRRRHRKPKGDQLADETLQPGTQHRLIEKRQQMRRLFLGKVESSPSFEPQVKHLMSKQLRTITPQKPVSQVIRLMETHRIRHLLVCKKDGQLCGIISDRDLKKQGVKTAADIMTPEPITVSPEMTVGTAITIMLNHGISCLPVIDHGKVTGLLTTTDLILSLQCSLQILSQLTLASHTTETASLRQEDQILEYTPTEDEELATCC